MLYPALARRDRPPAAPDPADAARVEIDGIALAGLSRAKTLLVVAEWPGEAPRAAELPLGAAELAIAPIEGFDPELGWLSVRGSAPRARFDAEAAPAQAWERAVAASRRALGHELVGVAEALLAIAVRHVVDRRQFGRAIGSFQTVQHRLADVRIAIAAARSALGAAAEDAAADGASAQGAGAGTGGAFASAAAKALAGRAALLASRHCPQLCGALGFSAEQGVYRYVRRAGSLDALLGGQAWLAAQIGEELLASRRVPRIGELRGT